MEHSQVCHETAHIQFIYVQRERVLDDCESLKTYKYSKIDMVTCFTRDSMTYAKEGISYCIKIRQRER